MTDFARVGRLNKNRGRAFERSVAEYLEWTRVPYSGAMSDWGGGDVVDGFYEQSGYWSAECKTQPKSPSLSVKPKWIKQMQKGATNGRTPIIITRNKGMSVSVAAVFMREADCRWFLATTGLMVTQSVSIMAAGNENGFFLPLVEFTPPIWVDVHLHDLETIERWLLLDMYQFRALITANDLSK